MQCFFRVLTFYSNFAVYFLLKLKEMKNLLITGSKGQLGNELRLILETEQNKKLFRTYFTDIDSLDITDEVAVENFFNQHKIDFIINCAAYTAVDRAESDKELCYKINTEAVKILVKEAKKHSVKIVQISTDYVFDGRNCKPYTEDDTTNAQSVYGSSKTDSEKFITDNYPADSIIIRTSWLYSKFGGNFVKTMIRLGSERDSLNVVFDQIGTPTNAADLAGAIVDIVKSEKFIAGIYHYSNEGVCSWYDFAKEIMTAKGLKCKVNPILSCDYPTPATRPHFSLLDKQKIKTTYHIKIPHWRESLINTLKEL